MKCNVGDVVQSKAGKDLGFYYVVSAIIDKDYVYMVDGKNRKLCKPKKKKIKHLIVCESNLNLKKLFEQATYILDSDIRKELKNYENM